MVDTGDYFNILVVPLFFFKYLLQLLLPIFVEIYGKGYSLENIVQTLSNRIKEIVADGNLDFIVYENKIFRKNNFKNQQLIRKISILLH